MTTTNSQLPAWLQRLEVLGNKIPNPTLLFIGLCAVLLPLTALVAFFNIEVAHPSTGATIAVKSLISSEGVFYIVSSLVSNFMNFAPVGVVLVAMLGIGIAEKSGLLEASLKRLVTRSSRALLIPLVALAGVLSSVAADAGYVVLIPLAALLFKQAGYSPALGIAVCFAAVSGGFGANLVLGPIDAILAGISTSAARIVDPEVTVAVSSNYWFMVGSTLLVVAVITLIARLCFANLMQGQVPTETQLSDTSQSLWKAAVAIGIYVLIIGAWVYWYLPADKTGVQVLQNLVVIIAVGFAVAGLVFGFSEKRFNKNEDIIHGMENVMAAMAPYIVLMFFVAQFVSWFQWSNLALVIAVQGAQFLQHIALPNSLLIIAFIAILTVVNLFIGSASAKWALLAPIFIPMFMLSGISPELAQAAFRVGDSATNIITPLMPYFALVLGFLRQHQQEAGVGTLLALMLPFSLALLVSWTLFLVLWIVLKVPLGF